MQVFGVKYFDTFPTITWQMPVPLRIMFHNHYMFDAKVDIKILSAKSLFDKMITKSP